MASLQQRSGWFHLHFRYQGRQHSHALKTKDRREAEAHRGTVDRLLIRIRNKELPPPPADADIPTFLLSAGKIADDPTPVLKPLTLGNLRDRYLRTRANGSLESKTIVMAEIHFRNLIRHFGERMPALKFTADLLQDYLLARGKAKGKKEAPIRATTIHKDIATLRAAWNLAVHTSSLVGTFPGRFLVYPKTDESPSFQTREEIQRKIARGGLTPAKIDDLWAGLFLTQPELVEFLEFARTTSKDKHLYPMLVFAAHTGARRSELLRMEIDDVDFQADSASSVSGRRTRVSGRRVEFRFPHS